MFTRPIELTVEDLFRRRGQGDRFEPIANRIDVGDCWNWLGRLDRKGYGRISLSADRQEGNLPMHRVMWSALVGPLDAGATLDHLCQNKACCNPDHLEVVDIRTNILRGHNLPAMNARATHCSRNHEFAGSNLRVRSDGGRACRECRRIWAQAKRDRAKVIA